MTISRVLNNILDFGLIGMGMYFAWKGDYAHGAYLMAFVAAINSTMIANKLDI